MLDDSEFRNSRTPDWRAAPLAAIASAVQKIGTPDFANCVLSSLGSVIEVDACKIVYEDRGRLCLAGQSGPDDVPDRLFTPMRLKALLNDTEPGAVVLSSPDDTAPSRERLHHVTIVGRSGGVLSALHILRAHERRKLRQVEISELRHLSAVFHSLVARHVELAHKRHQSVAPLEALDQIEACIAASGELTARESQVCARILYGMSTCGISLDLGIGKESVVTYRKRAYRRLVISSQRELLIWYLDCYDAQLMRPAA
ncbi:helix-turn-helix transcriptional regulator [Chachezhania sediminis]|uniref:helix-turn-helix transcriptional regulator n=1 Tax=Chachezhania sediminis TaxID=2599291 RepID=UPI00131B74E6|nr:LuxR C-terminal-related transcriptional regulator [Chachezhania sediminis]